MWVGYCIKNGGFEVEPNKIRAISDFPLPCDIADLHFFMGFVNQLDGFSKDVASAKGHVRPLLSSKNDFIWTSEHDEAFASSSHQFQPTL